MALAKSDRRRRAGRLAPTNGSVTRADVAAIYRECARDVDPPPTAAEFLDYLLDAIVDWTPTARQRAIMSRRQRDRWARVREQREAKIDAAAASVVRTLADRLDHRARHGSQDEARQQPTRR